MEYTPEPKLVSDFRRLKNRLLGRMESGEKYTGSKKWPIAFVLIMCFIAPVVITIYEVWPVDYQRLALHGYSLHLSDGKIWTSVLMGMIFGVIGVYLRYKIEIEDAVEYYKSLLFKTLLIYPIWILIIILVLSGGFEHVKLTGTFQYLKMYFELLILTGIWLWILNRFFDALNWAVFGGAYWTLIVGLFFVSVIYYVTPVLYSAPASVLFYP